MMAPKRTSMFYVFLWIGLVLQLARAECTPTSGGPETCKACGAIIGEVSYCSQCNGNGSESAPTDGVCTTDNAVCDPKADGTCTTCKEESFMYKGGCYRTANALGKSMCQTTNSNGVCTQAKDGYFVPPGADASHQSVIPCGDEEVVTIGDGKKYKGIPNCLTCTAPENGDGADSTPKAPTCNTCKEGFFGPSEEPPCQRCTDKNCATCGATGEGKCSKCKSADASGAKLYLKKGEGGTGTCVTEPACVQVEGYYIEGEECKKCSAPCIACTGQATHCTKCDLAGETPYLKDNNCVNEAACISGNTHYANATTKECKLCADGGLRDCTTCEIISANLVCKACTSGDKNKFGLEKKSCVKDCPPNSEAGRDNICACAEGFEPNSDWSTCRPKSSCKTPDCQTCDNEGGENEVCTRCFSTHYLTPIKQCVRSCEELGAYYTDSNNACQPCDPSCAACTGEGSEKCTACLPGKRLQYTDENSPSGGTCVDGCKPQSGAGGCETCGTTIGGTNYCSKCSMPEEVPINGVCKADNSRAPICSKKNNQGGCATCASGYFRQDNGCYKTDRQPGIQICTLASQGDKCETCANSLPPSEAGLCPVCDSACKTCSSANDANTCSSCFVGYYQVGTRCVKCDTNDPNGNKPITGVKDCISCAPPDGGNGGSVLCYLTKDDSTGGSTNKSGLSTGAIAGISVAAVVVVGGLVGFLCWWFICRGKA